MAVCIIGFKLIFSKIITVGSENINGLIDLFLEQKLNICSYLLLDFSFVVKYKAVSNPLRNCASASPGYSCKIFSVEI